MKILITGANGMLGKDLSKVLENLNHEVINTDVHNLDITNKSVAEKFILEENPEIVIHCAAYTDVDNAEKHFETAFNINVVGTKNIATATAKINSIFIYISTDYVFDGENKKPYEKDDIPNPINNYGRTKLLGEEVVKKLCKKYYIVRTSWLYGIYGKNFVEKMIELKDEPEIKVGRDQIGCPTWTVELSKGLIYIMESKPYGIYHICGKNETSWYDFAKEIFRQEGLNVNLIPCSSEEFIRPAKRPKYSVMLGEAICNDWEISLVEYLKLRKIL